MAEAMSQAFSSAEGMVSLGGAILIAVYLLFGLILNEYWIAWVTLLPAVLVVLLPRIAGDWVERIAPMPVMMKALGYTIVILGVVAIIEDLRFAGTVFDEFLDILAALASYVGYVVVFMGARSIKA
jgi:hypothetical protein